jgi:hypothetical protein
MFLLGSSHSSLVHESFGTLRVFKIAQEVHEEVLMAKMKILASAAIASLLALSPAVAQTTPAPAPDQGQTAAPSDAMAKQPMKKGKHKKTSKKKTEEKKPM